MNKKAMYFTIITVVFLIIFTFYFSLAGYKPLSQKMNVVEMRVISMNDFIKDLERDTERGLYISSYRSFLALESYIITNGTFIPDVSSYFTEALFNGTVHNSSSYFMSQSTLPLWVDKIKDEAGSFNINLDIKIGNISISQKDPWHVFVGVNFSYTINDSSGIASWDRKRYIETQLSIIGFEDPLYIIYSYGRMSNTINITPYSIYAYQINGEWNVSNLLSFIDNSYYQSNPSAPSYLMRLSNELGPSPYGIESMVDLVELSQQGLDINDHSSIIDYHYWDDLSDGEYRINFTPQWVKIDSLSLAFYNLTAISCRIGDTGCII